MIFATKENLFISYVKRDLVVSFRGKSASLNPLIFFVMIVLLMPLSLGSYSLALQKVAPGIIWIMALLSVLLSAGSIFDEDYNDGSLEQMIITPNLLFLIALIHSLLIKNGFKFTKCIIPTLKPFFSRIDFAFSAANRVTEIGIKIISLFPVKSFLNSLLFE